MTDTDTPQWQPLSALAQIARDIEEQCERRQHLRSALLGRQGGPGRVGGLRSGDGIADILLAGRSAIPNDSPRLGRIGDRQRVAGLPFLAPNV
jgi:hypothetical protein